LRILNPRRSFLFLLEEAQRIAERFSPIFYNFSHLIKTIFYPCRKLDKTLFEMETLRIKAYPKNKTQIKSITDFLSKEGIAFEMVEKEEFLDFIYDMEPNTDLSKNTENEDFVKLSNDQIKAIEIGQNQIKNGQTKPHDQVIFEMKEWLENK